MAVPVIQNALRNTHLDCLSRKHHILRAGLDTQAKADAKVEPVAFCGTGRGPDVTLAVL